jgi:mevalonate kinase
VVKQIEDWQHGKSSGADQAVVREGGMIWFRKDQGIKRLKVKNLPEFLLISSGVPVENTGEMVAAVAARYKRQPAKYQQIFKRMGAIAEEIFNCQKPIFNLIKENERLLQKIGVVGEKAKEMVRKIERRGGVAKVCGAGGAKNGSGILLGYHEDIGKLKQLVKNNNWQYYQVKLGAPGVRYETN